MEMSKIDQRESHREKKQTESGQRDRQDNKKEQEKLDASRESDMMVPNGIACQGIIHLFTFAVSLILSDDVPLSLQLLRLFSCLNLSNLFLYPLAHLDSLLCLTCAASAHIRRASNNERRRYGSEPIMTAVHKL